MKTIIKQFLSYIKEKLLSQSIIRGELILGVNSTISSSLISGKLETGRNCIVKGINIEGTLSLRDYTTIWGPNTNFYGNISIGSFCSIANNVSFFENSHNPKNLTTYFIFKNLFKEGREEIISKGQIRIGSDVWIGSGVTILSGVKVGSGVVIAANSVVNTDLPPYSICAGTPAKVLKYRFEEKMVKKLLVLKWWYWDINKILKNRQLFEGELTWEKLNNLN